MEKSREDLLLEEFRKFRADMRQCMITGNPQPAEESLLSNIFKHHFSWIITLLLATGGWLWSMSSWKAQTEHMQADFAALRREVTESNTHGSEYAREQVQSLRSVTDFHDKRLTILETDGRLTTTTLNELKADLRAIRDWVDDQKKKESIK